MFWYEMLTTIIRFKKKYKGMFGIIFISYFCFWKNLKQDMHTCLFLFFETTKTSSKFSNFWKSRDNLVLFFFFCFYFLFLFSYFIFFHLKKNKKTCLVKKLFYFIFQLMEPMLMLSKVIGYGCILHLVTTQSLIVAILTKISWI